MTAPLWPTATLGILTVSGWATLAVLAVLPVGAWPHTGIRGNVERAMLYFAVAAVTRATITDHQTRWQIAALAVVAVLFEIGRASMAGRSNGVAGWMSSTAGVVFGAVLLRQVAHACDWQWG